MSSEDHDEPGPRLTETSYIVLGLLEQIEPATPYDVKQLAHASTANFWALPHTQLYTECARLAGAGLLDERQEETGRRRRIYRLTERGRGYLDAWRDVVESGHYELRDEATLKLFFGADPKTLARKQVEAHQARLKIYEQLLERAEGLPRGQRLALDCGIGHEREFVRFWSSLADGD